MTFCKHADCRKNTKSINAIHKPPAGENLKGSTVTARACLVGANWIDAGGLRIDIKNQRPPAEVAPAHSRDPYHAPCCCWSLI
jgi:hypothetical protein